MIQLQLNLVYLSDIYRTTGDAIVMDLAFGGGSMYAYKRRGA